MLYLLQLRFKQGFRAVKEAGVIPLVLLVLCMFVPVLRMISMLLNNPSIWIPCLVLAMVTSLHFARNDLPFLKKIAPEFRWWTLGEYLSILLPFFCLYLYKGWWLNALVLILGSIIISRLPSPDFKRTGKSFINWPRLEAIFMRVHFRKIGWIWAIAWLVSLIFIQWEGAALIAILICTAIFSDAFDSIEPKDWIIVDYTSSKAFLRKKILIYLKWFWIVFSPHILGFLFFHTAIAYLLIPVVLFSSLAIVYYLFYKYANYHPFSERIYNSTPAAIFFIMLIIPFFLPVSIFLLIKYWRKAHQNLTYYYG